MNFGITSIEREYTSIEIQLKTETYSIEISIDKQHLHNNRNFRETLINVPILYEYKWKHFLLLVVFEIVNFVTLCEHKNVKLSDSSS